jgi:alpha-L-fucosidase
MPDGRIEPRQADRFREIGRWLNRYGESIYATRGGPFKPGPWGASTQRQETVYVHILQWENESITLPGIKQKIAGSSLLTGGTAQVSQSEKGIEISVSAADRHELDTIVTLRLDGPSK